MADIWIALNSIPTSGVSRSVDDATIWTGPAEEFGMRLTVQEPLKAEVFLLPQEGGCFVRGRIQGVVSLPCDRCTEETLFPVDQSFDSFELVPGTEGDEDEAFEDDADACVVRMGDHGAEINIAALLWQEFSLALPVHPLCKADCSGLCPQCGINLNDSTCACARDEGDPRLAALRGLTIKQ